MPPGRRSFNAAQTNVAQKYGGWFRVLDPSFTPTAEFYEELTSVGISHAQIDELRQKYGQPERDAWLDRMAWVAYGSWLPIVKRTPKDLLHLHVPCKSNDLSWLPDKLNPVQETYRKSMNRFGISSEEVDRAIESDPVKYPPLVKEEPDDDPFQSARVPRRPLPIQGDSSLELALPDAREDESAT